MIRGVVIGEGPTIDVVGYGPAETHPMALSDLRSGRQPIERSTEKRSTKTWILTDMAEEGQFLIQGNTYLNRTLPMLLGVEVDACCLHDEAEEPPTYRVTYKKGAGPQSWNVPGDAS